MTLRSFIIPAFALASAICTQAVELNTAKATPLKVNDIEVEVNEQSQTLWLNIDLDMADMKLPADREMIFTPVIIAEKAPTPSNSTPSPWPDATAGTGTSATPTSMPPAPTSTAQDPPPMQHIRNVYPSNLGWVTH